MKEYIYFVLEGDAIVSPLFVDPKQMNQVYIRCISLYPLKTFSKAKVESIYLDNTMKSKGLKLGLLHGVKMPDKQDYKWKEKVFRIAASYGKPMMDYVKNTAWGELKKRVPENISEYAAEVRIKSVISDFYSRMPKPPNLFLILANKFVSWFDRKWHNNKRNN